MRSAWVALALAFACAGPASAHQIPSLTVEALFSADRSFSLRVTLDPRLFLSDQPSSLPPVPVEWYREQTQSQLVETVKRAREYLRGALEMKFGDETLRVADYELTPMDGATNMPLAADSKEVHLLAVWKGRMPDGASSFQIALSHDANVSMILINTFEGEAERRPNVIFPGETSRPFVMKFPEKKPGAAAMSPTQKIEPDAEGAAQGAAGWIGGLTWAAVAAAVVVVAWLVMRGRRARGDQDAAG